MHTFTSTFIFPFPFHEAAISLWHKYPNPFAPHVISVDVVSRTVTPDGVVRTEKVIGVKQSVPRWVMKLMGGVEDTYVREVSFTVPATSTSPSKILMSSLNLSLCNLFTCHESILYSPYLPKPGTGGVSGSERGGRVGGQESRGETLFKQAAVIQTQGKFAEWEMLSRRIERWSLDRFASNASIGRSGFESVQSKLFSSASQVRSAAS